MQLWVYLAILSIYGDSEYLWQFWVFLAILSIFGDFEICWRFLIFFTILSIFDYFEQLVWLEWSFQALTIGTTYIWF